jgi:RNA polymerase sigma factor (sigma-70 family)
MICKSALGFVPSAQEPEHPFDILPKMPNSGAAAPVTSKPLSSKSMSSKIPVSIDQDDELHALLARIVRGEEAALRELYEISIGRVYGLALRITGRADAAEEVAADVFVQVWRDATRYEPQRARVLTWMLTICRSRAIDYLRRRDPAEPLPEADELTVAQSTPGDDPQDLLSATQSNGALHAALGTLAPRQRQLLALAFFRGLTHEEIAQHSGMPLGSVKTHIRKALGVLRGRLADENTEDKR